MPLGSWTRVHVLPSSERHSTGSGDETSATQMPQVPGAQSGCDPGGSPTRADTGDTGIWLARDQVSPSAEVRAQPAAVPPGSRARTTKLPATTPRVRPSSPAKAGESTRLHRTPSVDRHSNSLGMDGTRYGVWSGHGPVVSHICLGPTDTYTLPDLTIRVGQNWSGPSTVTISGSAGGGAAGPSLGVNTDVRRRV